MIASDSFLISSFEKAYEMVFSLPHPKPYKLELCEVHFHPVRLY